MAAAAHVLTALGICILCSSTGCSTSTPTSTSTSTSITATTTTTPTLFDNGANGTYSMPSSSPTNKMHARLACESFAGVGKCESGTCGDFSYYNVISDGDCSTSKTGYEWIYRNDGYTKVGQDYGDSRGSESVVLNALFVRQKVSSSGSWSLVLQNLGVASTSTSTTLDVCSQLALAKALASRVCGNCTEECSEACLFANDFASERRPENRPEHWLTHVVCSEGVDVVHDDWRFSMHPLTLGFAFLMATLLYCQYNECGEFTCRGAQL